MAVSCFAAAAAILPAFAFSQFTCLFILFLVMAVRPEGMILTLFRNLLLGLVGK